MKQAAIAIGVLLALVTSYALGHGGGLNAEGCHNERKTGGYHCHRAAAVAQPQALAATAPKAAPALVSLQPLPPTCHVGPRGGTYTITPSGRKNYSGC